MSTTKNRRRQPAVRSPAKRTVSVILELLRGADLEPTSRKYRVTAAHTAWRDRFLARRRDPRQSREAAVKDDERRRLKSVLASVSIENELSAREDRAHRERPPFGVLEVKTLSRTVSRSSKPVLWCSVYCPAGAGRIHQVFSLKL